VIELGEPAIEVGPELPADEAGRRCVDRELGEPVEEIDLTAGSGRVDHPLDLVRDRGGVAAHELVVQGLIVQRLPPLLRRCIEHDAGSEDRLHERIRLGLIQQLLGGPEEGLVGLRSAHEHDVPVAELELPDGAAFVADAPHEPDGIEPELVEMALRCVAP
jgi:hypothetical protein